MKGFEDVTLQWRGQDFTVPADRQLMMIAEIEDAIRGPSDKSCLQILMSSGGPSVARLSAGYAAALQFAGASVTAEEVYLSIQEGLAQQDVDALTQIQTATISLISIISPPIGVAISGEAEPDKEEKKDQAAG